MRCKNCGNIIDDNARFCTKCDTDNYPEMNKIRTKTDNIQTLGYATSQSTVKTVRDAATSANATQQKQTTQQKKKGTNLSTIIVIIIIMWILFQIIVFR